ncbi:hypothetical protein PV326_002523 [Microctonus aethiopoides]|nr:hypothetical protein PV326_002523 [Microctonus aethiopoides]
MPVRVYGRRCCGMQGGSLALINKDMRYLIREKTEREVRLWWYDWPKAYNAVLAEGASPLLLNEDTVYASANTGDNSTNKLRPDQEFPKEIFNQILENVINMLFSLQNSPPLIMLEISCRLVSNINDQDLLRIISAVFTRSPGQEIVPPTPPPPPTFSQYSVSERGGDDAYRTQGDETAIFPRRDILLPSNRYNRIEHLASFCFTSGCINNTFETDQQTLGGFELIDPAA